MKNNKRFLAFLLFFSCAALITSQELADNKKQPVKVIPIYDRNVPAQTEPAQNPVSEEPAEKGTGQVQAENLMGMLPSGVLEIAGAPEAVYPMRGESQWQDDVIFYYPTNLYLFFYDNRVWQVRADHRFKGEILGLSPGMEKSRIRELLGKPYHEEENEEIYLNPAGMTRLQKGFPVRLRLIFGENGELYDIYLYRGDY